MRPREANRLRNGRAGGKVRYAVVGAGHIAQNAVLPAFANADRHCALTAIVSDDPRKRSKLGRLYGVEHLFDYAEYDEACTSGVFDAVYIALPNSMHCDFTCRAAAAGIHVLCEKPMADTSEECRAMIDAAASGGVKLMIAYRLHFEAANLKAIDIARSGKLGELRLFNSVFSMQVRKGNIRLDASLGGGPLGDLGVYCINAARYLFNQEPIEVVAFKSQSEDPRFEEVEEAVSAVLRFPGERLASFTCSFGAADAAHYQILGSSGDLRVDPAYEYEGELRHHLTLTGGEPRTRSFKKRDQFAPELIYFAECIRQDKEPKPGGAEGLLDVQIIEAIHDSIETGKRVRLAGDLTDASTRADQEMRRPPPRKKPLINARRAHR